MNQVMYQKTTVNASERLTALWPGTSKRASSTDRCGAERRSAKTPRIRRAFGRVPRLANSFSASVETLCR